jgi:hypothetical protein
LTSSTCAPASSKARTDRLTTSDTWLSTGNTSKLGL